jgi:ketosteroid isomerase-like protein
MGACHQRRKTRRFAGKPFSRCTALLPPLKYLGAAAYRKSWGDWQPDTQGEGQFELQDLLVTADERVAFASCLIQCGGTLPSGQKFEDLVRATFCLEKLSGQWKVVHQHISKPYKISGAT